MKEWGIGKMDQTLLHAECAVGQHQTLIWSKCGFFSSSLWKFSFPWLLGMMGGSEENDKVGE